MGADIDKHVNDSGGPPVFKISGQVHHRIGSLLPAKGASPKFVELYIHETQNEVNNRIKAVMPEADPTEVDIDVDIVGGLQSMLDVCSPLVKKFRDARDRLKDEGDTRIAIRIVGAEKGDPVQFNLPAVSELAALIVGDFSAENYRRDIIVDSKLKGLHHVPSLHPAFMSLQYPLLFPHGDRGFQLGIPHRDIQPGCTEGRTTVSMQEYYCFCCHYRQNQYNPFLCCGKLSAQSQVDSFACVEEGRLTYIAGHQDDFRCEHFQGVADAVGKGNLDGSSIGKKRIVPASFIGGDRYQQQNFQDAVAICRVYGSPHLFPTFTCCPKWPEIKEALLLEPGQRYTDRSDLVVRVFKMKLDELVGDISNGAIFGPVSATLDRSLRDVLSEEDASLALVPFGGKVVVLGGDLRQILPVVEGGVRSQTVNAAITSSFLWSFAKNLELKENMRLKAPSLDAQSQCELSDFGDWILDVGNGTVPASCRLDESEPTWIELPLDVLIMSGANKIQAIIDAVYTDFTSMYKDTAYLCARAILSPTNDVCNEINDVMLSMVPGEQREYFSYDCVSNVSDKFDDITAIYQVELLNAITVNNFPDHRLVLKVGMPIMLLHVLGQIVGVSKLGHVRMSTNSSDTAKRVIALRDDRNTEVKLVLWGQRAVEFDAELVFDNGQNTAVVGVFVGLLMKSYNNDETLSGGSACRWYLNEDIPEIDSCFDRLGDDFAKVQWISTGTEKFAASRNRADLPHKTVAELRELDPWETEATDFLCTVSITSVAPEQPWWFQSCSKCHRSATSYGSEYRCSGGCVSTKAYPKYRLCLVGTDGTGSAEFVFFNRVAQQLVGKTVMSLLRSSGLPREIAAVVCQKYTLAVSVTQKSLSQRNISFQVNAIETFFGRQNSVPHDTRVSTILPLAMTAASSLDDSRTSSLDQVLDGPSGSELPVVIPELTMPAEDILKKAGPIRMPLRSLKRKEPEGAKTSKNLTKDAVLTSQNIDPDSIPRNASPPVKLASEVIAAGNEVHLHGKSPEVEVEDEADSDAKKRKVPPEATDPTSTVTRLPKKTGLKKGK
ncbi:hypothetical protein ACQ4PT_014477 [Festuca glaucescens]